MKKYLVKPAQTSLLAIMIAGLAAVPISADTLKETLAAAYSFNPQLEAQRAALRATDENVRQAKSQYLPSISGNYNTRRAQLQNFSTNEDGEPIAFIGGQETLLDTVPDFVDAPRTTRSLSVDQNIFRGFRTHNQIEQAKAQIDAGRAQLLDIEQNVLLQAVQAYMNVYRDTSTAELNANNISVLERQLQASKDRFRVGEITRTDVAQSEARLEVAKAQLLQAEAALAGSRATYERIVGQAPVGLEDPGEIELLPTNLEEAIQIAIEKAPAVAIARGNEEAASRGVSVAKGSLLPTVTLSGNITESSGGQAFADIIFTGNNNSRSIGLNVSVPIYQGGVNHSQVRRAKQIRSQRMLEIRQAENIARESALTAWSTYVAAQGQIISQEAAVRANEIALDGVRQEANVGSRTTLDVLDAEQELLASRVNLVGARRDRIVAGYQLLSALGRLTARELELGVEIYDPEDNYHSVKNKIIGW